MDWGKFVLLAAGVATVATAVPESVYNFRILSSDERAITFSWEVVGIHYSRYTQFIVYYSCDASDQEYSLSYSWVDNYRSSISTGRTQFNYTMALTDLTSQCQQSVSYVMWLTMSVGGRTLYSQQIYTETFDRTAVAVEMRIKMASAQDCQYFTSTLQRKFQTAVLRRLRLYCNCTDETSSHIFMFGEYVTCSTSDYATFRSYLQSKTYTSEDLSAAVSGLKRWLQDSNNSTVTIYKRLYRVETGTCGVTVPYLYAPFCDSNEQTGRNSDTAAVVVSSVFAVLFFIVALFLAVIIFFVIKQLSRMNKPSQDADKADRYAPTVGMSRLTKENAEQGDDDSEIYTIVNDYNINTAQAPQQYRH